jgi:hypothetical protein
MLMVIWHIVWPFGILFPVLVCCVKKNLAALSEYGPPKVCPISTNQAQPTGSAGFNNPSQSCIAAKKSRSIFFRSQSFLATVDGDA